jgi:methylmalonyl-CoA carboxyltransferase large subunit
MATVKEKIENLRKRESEALLGGGSTSIEKQHQKGKLTARERLQLLFDNGYYQEFNQLVENSGRRISSVGGNKMPGDGMVTATGPINGRIAYSASQDFTVMGGSLGEMHAWKMSEAMLKSLKNGCPFIAINDSGGARIQEAIFSLRGYGEAFYNNTALSGVVPQISIIAGPCAGGAAYSPALMDFIIMVKNTGQLFITGPAVIKGVTGEVVTAEDLGGAMAHATKSGNIHFVAENDQHAIEITKQLLSYLPQNNTETPPNYGDGSIELIEYSDLNSIIPDDPKEAYNMLDVINRIVDPGSVLEVKQFWATNILTCFARINGETIGIIANQPCVKAGCLDIDASDKASEHIRFCNAFNIPLLTLVDVPGFLPGVQQEYGGIIRHGAKMLFSYSAATVPKITVVIRKAYGGAYLAMCAKSLGADRTAAWPTAEIAVMGAEGAVAVLNGKEIKEAKDPAARKKELMKEYEDRWQTPYPAAEFGLVDAVIEPVKTREYISVALQTLKNKSELRPAKKHGLIPM